VIQGHEALDVYQLAFKAAMRIFEISKGVSSRGDLFVDRSDASVVEVSMLEYRRGVAKATV